MTKKAMLSANAGGTTLTAAVVDESFRIVWEKSVPTPAGGELMRASQRAEDRIAFTLDHWDDFLPHREELLDAIAALLLEAGESAREAGLQVRSAGVGVTGAVDPLTGWIVGRTGALNQPAWGEFNPTEALKDRTGLAIICLNDAKAMALGSLVAMHDSAVDHVEDEGILKEKPFSREGRTLLDFIEIDPGTGLGGGYVHKGKVWYGDDPAKPDPDVGEIWKHPVDPSRPGERFEEMACGRAIAAAVNRRGRELGDRDVDRLLDEKGGRMQDLLAAGNSALETLIREELAHAGRVIGLGILFLNGPEKKRLNSPDIDAFVIGGGMVGGCRTESTAVRALLARAIHETLENEGMSPRPRVLFTTIGGRAALLGGAFAVFGSR